MILGRLAIALSIATVLALDLILLLGAGIQDPGSIRPVFGGLVMVMDLCLVSSSSLLGFSFARLGNKRPAALFFSQYRPLRGGVPLRGVGCAPPPAAPVHGRPLLAEPLPGVPDEVRADDLRLNDRPVARSP